VRDQDGAVLADVEISHPASGKTARSDSVGTFFLGGLPAGRAEILLRRLAYSPIAATLDVSANDTTAVIVTLRIVAQQLTAMIILETPERLRDLTGFEHRRKTGAGHYITRAEIEQRQPLHLSEMLRLVPGAVVAPLKGPASAQVRFGRAISPMGDCAPVYWVDGIRATGLNIDDILPIDVEGLELYSGPAGLPPQFHPARENVSCGTVVIWTRRPG
jgi:hypothetical protein